MKSTNSANWILVTGTSSGIGRAATFTLAENGYRVLAAVRKQGQFARLETSGCGGNHYCSDRTTDSSSSARNEPTAERFLQSIRTAQLTTGSLSRLFSAGHMRSPVSRRALGECNAITSRRLGRSKKSPALGIDQAVQHSDFLALNGVSQAQELYEVGHLEQHHSSRDVDLSYRCPVHPERERDGQECEVGEADSAQLPQLASACGQALSGSVQW